MRRFPIIIVVALVCIATAFVPRQQTKVDPWKPEQLMEPAALADVLKSNTATKPLVICVGPSGVISGSVETGPAGKPENLTKLKNLLVSQPKNREIVLYCGCCPFEHCPNVRPAFTLLNDMHFAHPYLLNLSHNIKTDWIDKGYPVH
ncbi:rhodanese-like domain-containing protein [Deminuibacter soli]|uniref:Rhodanese-like domain-containing protein n=1 Tax=Deminuibacter soli TaxID=2291815 RepID=A0A3E1NCW6_9BACT|nr:rhodanese-like domain-containing protein [Deminuibacter soli]RFM25681.1 rhodanese-like domain-containing protein [Deminuibacter soli]